MHAEVPHVVFDELLFLDSFEMPAEQNRQLLALCTLPGSVVESLVEGLGRVKKSLLKELADDLALEIKSTIPKVELVELVAKAVEQSFGELLRYLPTVNIDFLFAFEGNVQRSFLKEELRYRDISHAHNLGYLMLYETDDAYIVVFPRILSEQLKNFDHAKVRSEAEFHQRIAGYAISLTNLYGVLDIDQFAAIWNRYESETLTPASAGDELAILTTSWYSFWYHDEYIVSSFFEDVQDVDSFLTNVRDIPYYVPTRKELRDFFSDPYDEHSPAVLAMKSFLLDYELDDEEDLENLIADLSDVCIADTGVDDALDLLQQYGVSFKDFDDASRFTKLYSDLDSHARKWILRGHTKDSSTFASKRS